MIQTTPRNSLSTHLTPRNNIATVGKENKLTKLLHNLKGETLRSVCQDLGLPPIGEKEVLTSRIVNHADVDEDLHCARPPSISSDTSSQVQISLPPALDAPSFCFLPLCAAALTLHSLPGHHSQRASARPPPPRPRRPVPQPRPLSRRRFHPATAPRQPPAGNRPARVPGRLRGARPRPRLGQSPRRPLAGPPHPPLRRLRRLRRRRPRRGSRRQPASPPGLPAAVHPARAAGERAARDLAALHGGPAPPVSRPLLLLTRVGPAGPVRLAGRSARPDASMKVLAQRPRGREAPGAPAGGVGPRCWAVSRRTTCALMALARSLERQEEGGREREVAVSR